MIHTVDDFIAAVFATPRKWTIGRGGSIRTDDGCHCPATYVDRELKFPARPEFYRDMGNLIYDAADNNPGHDPAIRSRLLEACGLEEPRA